MNHGQGVARFQIMRVFGCAGVALSIALGTSAASAQDLLDRCAAPLIAAPELIDPSAFWEDDRAVEVWREQDGDRYAYHIAGDIVELTQELFSAFATTPGNPLRTVSEITVDARKIIVSMPIRLENGTIKLYGDTVTFTGAGTISLIDPPSTQDQTVEIVAETLDLSHAPDMPFMFPTKGWILNAQPEWPASDAAKRILRVKARTVVLGDNESEASRQQLKDDPLRWFHNRTADQGFDSGLPKEVWSSGYDIAIGQAGGSIYDGLFGATLIWPDLAVAKLTRLHARAPFDLIVNAYVRAKIDELRPRLARRASQQANAALDEISEQMALNLDSYGYAPSEVSMTGLSDRLKAFQKSLDEVFGTGKKAGTLQLWDQTRMLVLAADLMVDPAKQVNQLDRMLRAEISDRTNAAQRVGENAAKLLKMIQDGQAKIAEAAKIGETLLAQYTSEKEQAASFGRIVDDLVVNETTIGIGRPAATPYSLVSNPAATAPESFYGAKDGGLPAGAPDDLNEIAGRYQSYATLIADFDAAWKAVEPHMTPALGHLTGKQKNDDELAAFRKAMAEVHEKGEALRAGLSNGPAEFTIGLNDYTPVDEDQQKKWTSMLQEAEAAMTTAGSLQAMVLADERQVQATDADIAWLSAIREDFLALKSLPKEVAVQRQAMLSSLMSARLLADIARATAVLRKGFYYVTGQLADVPDKALYPDEDALASWGMDLRHPEHFDPDKMQAALNADRTALNEYYESLAGKFAEQAGAFVDKQPAVPPSVEFFRAAYEEDISHDLEASFLRARFLDSLNRSIAAQIALGRSGAGFAAQPILLPISVTPAGPSGGAQFLLGAAITKVHFEGDPKMGSRIDLRIEHPRWGTVTIDGNCHRVVDAADAPGGIETGFSKAVSIPQDVKPNWKDAVPTDQALAKILDNAFPLDAPYYVYVDVAQPSAWRLPPVIDEIEIMLVKTGTRLQ
ncbi:MAG: hypothetical protein R3D05_06970 [Dongiaceae bacterium]